VATLTETVEAGLRFIGGHVMSERVISLRLYGCESEKKTGLGLVTGGGRSGSTDLNLLFGKKT